MQPKKKHCSLRWNFSLWLALLLATTACTARAESLPTPTVTPLATSPSAPTSTLIATSLAGAPAPLSEELLANLEYQGIYEEPVKLVDGEYAGEPFVEGGAARPVLRLQTLAIGDLDQDGVSDAAIVLAENSGGSGSFIFLAAVVNREAGPLNTSTLLLGDRIQIQSIELEDGLIRLAALTHRPDDPLCCPSQPVEMLYQLVADQLAPVESP